MLLIDVLNHWWSLKYSKGSPKDTRHDRLCQPQSLLSVLPEDMLMEISSSLDVASLSRLLGTSKRISNIKSRTKMQHLSPSFGANLPWRNRNIGLWQAARENNQSLVDFFINIGADDWNFALSGASTKQLIDTFIQKGANDFNRAMTAAVRRNDKDLVDYLIQKGANDWDGGLNNAILTNQQSWVDFFWNKGIRNRNRIMKAAISTNNQPLIDRLITDGARDFDAALKQALWQGNLALAEFFVTKGARDLKAGLSIAIFKQDMPSLVLYLLGILDHKYGRYSWNYDQFLTDAVQTGNMEFVELFLDRGILNINPAMLKAVEKGYKDMVEVLVEEGGNDLDGAIEVAKQFGQTEVQQYFEERKYNWKQELKKHLKNKKAKKTKKRY